MNITKGTPQKVIGNVIKTLVTYVSGAEICFSGRDRVKTLMAIGKYLDYDFKTIIHDIIRNKILKKT